MHHSKVSRPFNDQQSIRHSAAPSHAGPLRTKAAPDGEAASSPRSAVAASTSATRVLFWSSTLFLVALAYAVWLSVWDVVIGTAATATTSLLNHWFMSQHAFFKALDTVVRRPPPRNRPTFHSLTLGFGNVFSGVSPAAQVVRSISAYFMIISYWALPLWHLVLVVACSSVALAAYMLYSRGRDHVVAHVIVHVSASVGILLYTAGLAARRAPDYRA